MHLNESETEMKKTNNEGSVLYLAVMGHGLLALDMTCYESILRRK